MRADVEKPLGNLQDVTADKIFDETVKRLNSDKVFYDAVLLHNLRELSLKNSKLALSLLKE